jgi:hypothetical protein
MPFIRREMEHFESMIMWWCIKYLFWIVITRDVFYIVIPYVTTFLKNAIEGYFKSEFPIVEEISETGVTNAASELESFAEKQVEEVVESETGVSSIGEAENVAEKQVEEVVESEMGVSSIGEAENVVKKAAKNYLQASLPLIESAAEGFLENVISGVTKRSRK